MKLMKITALLLLLLSVLWGPLTQAVAQEEPQDQIETLDFEDQADKADAAKLYDFTWRKFYKREGYYSWLRKLLKDKAGNTYTIGYVRNDSGSREGFVVQKRTLSGEVAWSKRMLTKHDFSLLGSAISKRLGEVYILGRYSIDRKARIWRFASENGQILSHTAFDYIEYTGEIRSVMPKALDVDPNGNAYVLLDRSLPEGNQNEVVVVKLNHTLDRVVWAHEQAKTEGEGFLESRTIQVTDAGVVSALSYQTRDSRLGQIHIHQLTAEGQLAWVRLYNDSESKFDMNENLLMTTDKERRVYVAATAHRNKARWSDTDMLTFCVSPKGRIAWTRIHDGGTGKYPAYPMGLALDGKGGVYVSGTNLIRASKYIVRYDQILIKYSALAGWRQWTQRHRPTAVNGGYTYNLGLEVDFGGNVYTVSHSEIDARGNQALVILGFRPDGRKFFERRAMPAFYLDLWLPGALGPGADLVITGKSIYLGGVPTNKRAWVLYRFDR